MATQSSTLAWKMLWMEEPGGLQSMGSLESDMTEWLHFHFSLLCIGEGNGNPVQRSCLENPRDRGAWWAAVYGVTQSQTQLKRLSSSSSRYNQVKMTKMSLYQNTTGSYLTGIPMIKKFCLKTAIPTPAWLSSLFTDLNILDLQTPTVI